MKEFDSVKNETQEVPSLERLNIPDRPNIKIDSDLSLEDAEDIFEKSITSLFDKESVGDNKTDGTESNEDEITARTPEHNGEWDGERGNSTWHPDPDYTPPERSRNPDYKPYSNPDNLSWGEILNKYGIDGIEFVDGFPVFDDVSRGTVTIDGFETGGNDAKNRNFARADIAMAEQRGCSPQEVKEWRENNNYTWHECEDKQTMQKVPNEIHANIPHDGGRSQ